MLRQDAPGETSYWQRHRIAYERDMNVISVLQRIAAQAETVEGRRVAPVAWDCNCLEEVCGACTMVINGHVRQACSALVDRLLEDNPAEIELRPMSKFPVAARSGGRSRRGCFRRSKSSTAGSRSMATTISAPARKSRKPCSRSVIR